MGKGRVQASLRDATGPGGGCRGLKATAIIESSLRDYAKLNALYRAINGWAIFRGSLREAEQALNPGEIPIAGTRGWACACVAGKCFRPVETRR